MLNTADTPRVTDAWPADDELDLRRYADILIRWWREIVLITGVVVVVAILLLVALRALLPPRYEASADVAIVRTSSNVSFDERFLTSAEQVGADANSANSRRSALVGLVDSGAIAEAVIAQLGDQLNENQRSPAKLMDAVSAEVTLAGDTRDASDLIRITAVAETPEKASAIANAWAQNYVTNINSIYSNVPNEVLTSIEAELAKAKTNYLDAQAAFEDFIANNQGNELNNRVTVLQQRLDQEVALVQSLLADWQQTNRYLEAARNLYIQVEQGGEDAARTNAMALQALKLSVYGMTTQNMQVELRELPELTQAAMLVDVQGLIVSLQERLDNLSVEAKARSANLDLPGASNEKVAVQSSDDFTAIYAQIRQLRAAIETNNAQRDQLEQQRNLNWEAYKALSSKVAELTLTRAAASSEVRFAAPAVVPADPIEPISLVTGTAIAAILGLFAAIVIVFLSNYLGQQPFLQRAGSR